MKTTFALAATLSMAAPAFAGDYSADPMIPGGSSSASPFASAIRPLTAPTIFDLALPRTQLHGIYMRQNMPSSVNTTVGGVPLGGDFDVYALQFEIALNERTSIVATKDGYIDFNPDDTLSDTHGFANLGLGIKHALVYDTANQFIVSGIATVEIPTGQPEVWQGEGDGAVNLNLAGLKLYDNLQLAGNLGLHIPFSDSQSLTGTVSLHASYEISRWFIPVIELNWFHTFDEGDGTSDFTSAQGNNLVPSVAQFEGGDLINLGSANAGDNRDAVTLGLGFRSRVSDNATIGFAYEIPLTEEEDGLMEDRFTVDFVLRF